MKRLVLVLALSSACGKKEPPPPSNEFEAFERKFAAEMKLLAEGARGQGREIDDKDVPTSYRAVFIGPSGVFVDSKHVATLAELDTKRDAIVAAIDANVKLLPSVGWTPSMTFDLDAQPASVAISALRLFTGHALTFNVRLDDDPEVPQLTTRTLCSGVTVRDRVNEDAGPFRLSVLLEPERIWVGLSKANEFQEIPNFGKQANLDQLQAVLRDHKAGPTFRERHDLELAATGGTSIDAIGVFGIACREGFNEIAVLPRDRLSAVPQP